MADEEDEEETEKFGQSSYSGEGMGEDETGYFSWLALVDNVGQLTRDKWDDVFRKNIYEFFNLLAYLKHKNKKINELTEKWKHQH